MSPEEKARLTIDQKLIQSGWVIQDMKRYVRLTKEYKELEEVTAAGDKYKAALRTLEESKEILATEKDPELCEMAEEEMTELTEKLPAMEQEIKMLLIPADPEDHQREWRVRRKCFLHLQKRFYCLGRDLCEMAFISRIDDLPILI